MAEQYQVDQSPRERVLGTVDDIVKQNPKIEALLTVDTFLTFSVGYCASAGEAQTPRQVVVADIKSSDESKGRVVSVVVQAADRDEDFRFWHLDKSFALDVPTMKPVTDEQVEELHGLLHDTDFSDPRLMQAFGAQYEQFMYTNPDPANARWWEGLLQEPVVDLSPRQA